jgi:CBS domain containing-hemolysin-like protein
MIELALSVLILLLSSALASGTEVALFSVPYGQVLHAVSEKRRGAVSLQRIKDDMARPIMAIVIVNNIANIVGTLIVGAVAARVFESHFIGAFSAVLTFLVIVFAEIIPKTVGERFAMSIALRMAVPVRTATKLMLPLIWVIELITRPFAGKDAGQATSEAEIRALTMLGQQTGAIEDDESELIQRVFGLNDVTARDIMTPLAQVDALDGRRTLGEVRHHLMTVTHTRLPVHKGSVAEVTGVVHLRYMLQALSNDEDDKVVQSLATEPAFIPETAAGDDLLRHFQRRKEHLAIVVDAFGTVLGILTLEDVLEELVGDIVDETDVETRSIHRVGPNELLVDAAADMVDIGRALDVALPEQGRIGEQLIAELGRIPTVGEIVELHELTITIDRATPRAVTRLRVVKG